MPEPNQVFDIHNTEELNLLQRMYLGISRSADHKCGALRDLVPCAQFKKREKKPCKSVTFSKVAG